MKLRHPLSGMLLILMLTCHAYGQQLSNVKVSPLGKKLVVRYNIEHEPLGQTFNIKASYALENGAFRNIEASFVTGDFGQGISGGQDLLFSWDIAEQLKSLPKQTIKLKLTAIPEDMQLPSDENESLELILEDIEKKGGRVIITGNLINKGKACEVQMPNRLIRIFTKNGARHEAFDSQLGTNKGTGRHAIPRVAIDSNSSVPVSFEFRTVPSSLDRIAILEMQLERLMYNYALDLKRVHFEWLDLPVKKGDTAGSAEYITPAMVLHFPQQNRSIDKQGPVVSILYPQQNKQPFLSQREILPVEGKVEDKNGIFEISINGFPAKISEDGRFSGEATLFEGNNTLFIRAVDKLDNATEQTLMVNYTPSQKQGQRQAGEGNTLTKETEKKVTSGNYFALLIGVDKYQDASIQSLDNPVKDANALGQLLISKYQFNQGNVFLLSNPTRERIIEALDQLNLKLSENDNLLVFYAGHGYWDPKDEIGYWLPGDANQKNTANWLRNSTLRDYLHAIKTKHTLLITDACFSGSIFKSRKAFADAPKSVEMLYTYPSRKAMTSGTLKEVPDRSVFMLYLLKRLNENERPYLSAEELFSSFRVAVMNNSPNVPQFGEIQNTGDEGGDFIFIKK